MKVYLPFILLFVCFEKGFNQSLLQYVFANEKREINDICILDNIYIGVGHSDPCGVAYICAVSNENKLIWDTSFTNLSYSFFTDVLKVTDSTFYAVGEEWSGDDIPIIQSVFVALMTIQGKVLTFTRHTSSLFTFNLFGPINCKINQLPSTDLIISVGNKLFYLTTSGAQYYDYVILKNRIIDFKAKGQKEIYYISDTSVNHYDKINSEELLFHGLKGLKSMDLSNSKIYVVDENNSLNAMDYNGNNLNNISDSIGCKSVIDFKISKDTLFVLGENLFGANQLSISPEIDLNKTYSALLDLEGLTFTNISVNNNSILFSGLCNYGFPNNFFITMNRNYNLPEITKDLAIYDFRQTDFKSKIVDSAGGLTLYSVSISFKYKILNSGIVPVQFFRVYSEIIDGINCVHNYYNYSYSNVLLPGEYVQLSGSAIRSRTTNGRNYTICLKVVAPDLELDRFPKNNTTCQTLVSNEELNSKDTKFNLYPNPVYDVVHVSTETTGNIKIYNSSGILISNFYGIKNIELDMSNYKSGIYFITTTSTGSNSYSQKFIKL